MARTASAATAGSWKRTHTCGELGIGDDGKAVTLCGWVANRRDHGGIFFIDVRDRYGITQVTVDPEFAGAGPGLVDAAQGLGAEDVVSISGTVKRRAAEQINPNRITGAVEVFAAEIRVLARSETPPFEILDKTDTSLDLRLKYRYLDLRRRPLQQALEMRGKFLLSMRKHLTGLDFIEVETPILTKATPEGARDYLVPSRVHKGSFYALPQSPQLFKQLCMVGGLDRYFQVARCFRDEDLRADRQPEFTQLDLEMSFVEEEDILQVIEGTMVAAFRECLGVDLPLPFPRLEYKEAMERYGIDKPDLRFGLELVDVAPAVASSDFQVFRAALQAGGRVKALPVPGGGELSRRAIDELGELAKSFGAKGLAWVKVGESELTGSIAKFFPGEAGKRLAAHCGAKPGDLLLFAADREVVVNRALAEVRNQLGRDLKLVDPKNFRFCWVVHFPLFDWSEERQAWEPSNHPFTAPVDWEADLSKDTGSHLARSYDLVLNGWEMGSGSVRIHRSDVQERVFRFLGLSEAEIRKKFGFLIEAFRYGAPPHGGIAFGIDRLVTMALGLTSIRDVIAFPKTASASCLMTDAPSDVAPEQLLELAVRVDVPRS